MVDRGEGAGEHLNVTAESTRNSGWAGPDAGVCAEVVAQAHANLEAYRVNPPLLEEQRNIEDAAAEGGYQGRQLYELIQNGADALLAQPGGGLQVVLTDTSFYCANEGEPIDVAGVRAILLSNVSQKRGDEIGRFGLGFKSVLEVTDNPEFYSRSGSFAWNYERTLSEIASAVGGFDPDCDPAPRLRLAWPIDPEAAFAQDPILEELAAWATTIVKLPLRPEALARLAEDVVAFPPEFLLFCRHVGRLALDNRSSLRPDDVQGTTESVYREIRLNVVDGTYVLRQGDRERGWLLLETVHEPSEAAKADAGVMSRRDRVPIDWALPLDERRALGALWTFFPTDFETTLSGIVNAPWKTNPDRRNLLEGAFNRELLEVVARMVVDNLPRLLDAEDPGRLLDIIPGREAEARGWEDRTLNEQIYELAAAAPSLPDADGQLCLPATLTLAPSLRRPGEEGAQTAQRLLSLWAEASPDRAWCHRSVDTRERRPRAERLIKDAGGHIANFTSWLEALVGDRNAAGSAAAVKIAAALTEEGLAPRHEVDRARIVLTSDGELARPDPEEVFLRSEYDAADDEIVYVDAALSEDPDVCAALAVLGIEAVDAAADLEASLRTRFSDWLDEDWHRFWQTVRRVGVDRAAGILRGRRRVPFVRTKSGEFRPLRYALLPGAVVPDDGSRDSRVVVDVEFHADDLELLSELGLRAGPEPALGSTDEPWFDVYEQETLVEYRQRLTGARRPQERLLGFLDKRRFTGPLTPLDHLSDEGRALFTEAVLAAEGNPNDWTFGHTTQRDSYPVLEVEPPPVWRLRREGRLRTSRGNRPASLCAAPGLVEWRDVLPVAACSEETAARLRLPSSLDLLTPDLWNEALRGAEQSIDDALIGRLYVAASAYVDAPARVRCRVGATHVLEPIANVTVVHDEREFAALRAEHVPTVLVPTRIDADALLARWGMSGERHVTTAVAFGAAADPVPMIDRFPALELLVDPDHRGVALIACSELRLETITAGGRLSDDIDFYADDGTVYYREELSDEEVLRRLAPQVDLTLDDAGIADVLQRGVDLARRELRRAVRDEPTLEAKLLRAVGTESLRTRLPRGLLGAVETDGREPDGATLAQLALAVYGVDVLRVFRNELRDNGFDPPQTWAASAAALSFVRKLGFPREFAGFRHAGRSPLLEVEGPPQVPDLHDFQREIVDEFRRLLRGDLDGQRAILSLPTGAGKTRVAVDALIEAVQHDGFSGPILWVTQSDELCEQAVQTWSFVWRGLGPARAKLAISRLWASNEVEPVEGATQVVVATVQKLLAGCINDPDYDWLADAGCVVIDEAHHSTTTGYTELLSWLGLARGRGTRPLVGLTATPFRGTSTEETERLVGRYGARRLDAQAFADEDPYPILQERGILAQVRHRVLGGADDFELTADELRMLERTRLFPRSAEERLGLDIDRNDRLLQEITALPEDWTILVFATSVDHAQTMAALLTLEGISAKPITGLTDAGPRRHYIEQFREGELRVLTNYAVLTQGFDAPAVRAIFVARPTYSPNLYQQMIGRGLRGPANGGKLECLIVNVEDNVRQFGQQLAFRDFEHLWTPSASTT
jgi:superfamily II DNA or RNA helicase